MSGAHHDADLTAIIGATGSGKSTRIKSILMAERPERLMVWDWKAEYPLPTACQPVELVEFVKQVGRHGAGAVAYRPRKDSPDWIARQFDIFCRLALALGDARVIVEELSNVTRASWAPQSWRNISTEGRHEALRVIGTSQRPALIDKTILSNATALYCGRLNAGGDKSTMADSMDVPITAIRELGQFQWLVKNCETGQVWRDDLAAPTSRKKRTSVRT